MIKKAKYWFRNIFGFSGTETNGAIILIILMILMFILPPVLRKVDFTSYDNYENDKVILDSMIAALEKKDFSKDTALLAYASPEYFSFDPNEVPEETLIAFGIPKSVTGRIINYRSKGGKFVIKSDLLKVYDFPSDKYKELHPYIALPENKVAPIKNTTETKTVISRSSVEKNKTPEIIDINTADTSQLKLLKGIGSVLSNRIIKYRNGLGGFISKDQFSEVYGLDEEVLKQLTQIAHIEPDFEPQKINVNQADLKQLTAHPYISKKLAQRIIAYREQHGSFKEENLLNDIKELDKETKERIYPYLEF